MASQRVTLFPLSNSVYISRDQSLGTNQSNVLGQVNYNNQIQDWQAEQPYSQKSLLTDIITVMVHIQVNRTGATIMKLYLCDKYKTQISTIDLNVAPVFKGVQAISGNNYTNAGTGLVIPLLSGLFSFTLGDFPEIEEGETYYIRCDNEYAGEDTLTYFSEPILVMADHPDTQIYKFAYNTNIARKNIVITDWYNDYPTNADPYTPLFCMRFESYINMYVPKVINIGYTQQSYRQVQIKTDQVTTYTLKIGEISIGIPYYILRMATEALLADKLTINNFIYILFNPQSQTQLSDLWKIRDADIAPLVYATTNIMLGSESQNAILSPTDDPFGGIFTSEFDSTFD